MSRRTRSGSAAPGIPEATIARLPLYLRALYALADRCIASVSSEELAAAAGVNSAKLRKDLSHLGSYGTRGVGYDVDYLIYQVSRELGLTQDWPVVIVGVGNLGRALANYGGFLSRGFRVVALLDSDRAVIGTTVAGHLVRGVNEIERVVDEHKIMIGAITVPAAAAQDICNRLVGAGVTSILNFAPIVLSVPDGVDVRKVDLSIELQILAFHAQRKSAAGRAGSELTSPGSCAVEERGVAAAGRSSSGRQAPGPLSRVTDLAPADDPDLDLGDAGAVSGGAVSGGAVSAEAVGA